MSFEALAGIRHVDAPGASATLLLFILAEYAGPDGYCWPSQATLSERSKLSVRAVRENLRLLEEAGLIAQERRNRRDGTRCSNRIRLTFYAPEQAAEDAGTLDQHTKSAGGHEPAAASAGYLEIELHDALRRSIEARPTNHLAFITTPTGEPYSEAGFGNWFGEAARKAGLVGCSAHGLRKAAARRLAEAGCTANEIAAVTGHSTLKEVARYTKAADQRRLAKAAIAKIPSTQVEQNLSNPENGLDKTRAK